MHDLRDELAALVADVAATMESLRLQGAVALPHGARAPVDLGPEPAPVRPAPSARAFTPSPQARATAPAVVPAPVPRTPAVTPPVALPPPTRVPAVTPPAALPPPPRVALLPEPAPPSSGGLLGAWGTRLKGPEDRLAEAVAALGSTCAGCGEPTLIGQGGVKSGLVLVAGACTPAERGVLDNMLLRVVGVEPADVWTVTPRPCQACHDAVLRQVEAIKPRVGLVLGAQTGSSFGLNVGSWGRLGSVPAIATFHPAEIAEDPGRKRPAFSALQEVAARR